MRCVTHESRTLSGATTRKGPSTLYETEKGEQVRWEVDGRRRVYIDRGQAATDRVSRTSTGVYEITRSIPLQSA